MVTKLLTCTTLWLPKRKAPGLSLERRDEDECDVERFFILRVGIQAGRGTGVGGSGGEAKRGERDSALQEGLSQVRGRANRGGQETRMRAVNKVRPQAFGTRALL